LQPRTRSATIVQGMEQKANMLRKLNRSAFRCRAILWDPD
jgi:hypothetical protein